ncbi:MAG: hypothetical protein LBK43_06300 [Treponema sp.]|nr:hypothetical protein [Treponema sp.]
MAPKLKQDTQGALQDGRLSRERLQQAAEQILAEKIRYGLMREKNKDE